MKLHLRGVLSYKNLLLYSKALDDVDSTINYDGCVGPLMCRRDSDPLGVGSVNKYVEG